MQPLPFMTRLWFAWACFFKVLFDGAFAGRAFAAQAEPPPLPPPPPSARTPKAREGDASARREMTKTTRDTPLAKAMQEVGLADDAAAREIGALQLLAALQRDGRLVDFVEQDIASFSDADVGAAARVVHEGCRGVVRAHATIAPIRSEEEGAKVTLDAGFGPEIKLTGDVRGVAPYKGTLKHKGWKATSMKLPIPVRGHDAKIVCPAEVEL